MDEQRHALRFDIRRSVRYHDRRNAHFERLHRVTNLVTVLLAGVVLMELAGDQSPLWIRILAGIGGLLGATDLVIGFSRRADAHRNFKRRFIAMEQEIANGTPTDQITQQRLTIEAEEPPIYRALDILCHNELCVSMGYRRQDQSDVFSDMPLYMRLTAN